MLRIQIQTPAKPDKAILQELQRVATALKGKSEVRKDGPQDTYSLTLHVLPDSSVK